MHQLSRHYRIIDIQKLFHRPIEKVPNVAMKTEFDQLCLNASVKRRR